MRKFVFFFGSFFVLFSTVQFLFAIENDAADQISKMTGVPKARTSKIIEQSYILERARKYAREGNIDAAVSEIKKVSLESGFSAQDVKEANINLFDAYKRAGMYRDAEKVAEILIQSSNFFETWLEEARALAVFQETNDRKLIDSFLSAYFERNKKLLPPKAYDLSMLAIIVRMYETIDEINEALAWAEKYYQLYFPNGKPLKKELSGVGKKRREGIVLLKEALLRDKAENKNIYAQELINTTEYFGFV